MDVLEGLAQNFTSSEKLEAKKIELKIKEITQKILEEKQSLDSNYVRLSQLIDEVRSKKYWLLGNYKTFGDYLADCEKKYGIKHSQLYVGMKIARNLLPSIPEQDLVSMGITKAGMLSKYVEQSGQSVIAEDVLKVAREGTINDLDTKVNQKLHNVLPDNPNKWFNLGGFYATEDERQEITEALDIAKSVDPVIPNNIPEWQQLKEAILRLAREFRSTY